MENVTYTPAQMKIKSRIERGDKVHHANRHHANGGGLFWSNGDVLRCRPFYGTLKKMAIEKGAVGMINIEFSAHEMYHEIVMKNLNF